MGTVPSVVTLAASPVVLGQKVTKEPYGFLSAVLGMGVLTMRLCQQTLPSVANGVVAAAALAETVLCVHGME